MHDGLDDPTLAGRMAGANVARMAGSQADKAYAIAFWKEVLSAARPFMVDEFRQQIQPQCRVTGHLCRVCGSGPIIQIYYHGIYSGGVMPVFQCTLCGEVTVAGSPREICYCGLKNGKKPMRCSTTACETPEGWSVHKKVHKYLILEKDS